VADVEGDWQLEVEVADQNIGFINEARRSIKNDLNVEFVLATDPEVTYQGTPLNLTPKEYGLLALFLKHHQRVF